MQDLSAVASRLRAVRRAESEFLARWAAENLLGRPIFLDGLLVALSIDGASTAGEIADETLKHPRIDER